MQATHTYRGIKYWHVASLGIILSKAGDNKGADNLHLFVRIRHHDMGQMDKVAKIRLYGRNMFQKGQTNWI